MHESLDPKQEIERVANRVARVHMSKALELRHRLAPRISLLHMREWQHVKAQWHENRAIQEAEETRRLLSLGVMTLEQTRRFEQLTDPNREPYIPKPSEFPPEVLPPEVRSQLE